MNVGEILSRCAAGCTIGALGGGASIRCDDLMHALGLVKAPEWKILLVRMKYLGEDERRSLVELMVVNELVKIAVERKWPRGLEGEQPFTKLAKLAIAEYLLSEQCPVCRGQKQIGPTPCQACDATGMPIISDDYRGRVAGFHPIRWQTWSDKYPYAMAIVRSADEIVLGAVRKRLELVECTA